MGSVVITAMMLLIAAAYIARPFMTGQRGENDPGADKDGQPLREELRRRLEEEISRVREEQS